MTQKKIKKLIISFLALTVSTAFLSIGAVAATPKLDLTKAGVIVVNLHTPDAKRDPVAGYGFELFHVANAIDDGGTLKCVPTGEFSSAGVDFNALDSASASKAAASLLASYAKEKGYHGLEGSTDEHGRLTYGNVKMGVHLLVAKNPSGVSGYYPLDPVLVGLPFLNTQGNAWKYAINVYPKLEEEKESTSGPTAETTSPDESTSTPDDATTNPDDATTQPEEPTSPTTRPDDSQTTIPSDQSGQGSGDRPNLPQTGLLRWPVPVLSSVGVILFGLGWADTNLKKRKKDDE